MKTQDLIDKSDPYNELHGMGADAYERYMSKSTEYNRGWNSVKESVIVEKFDVLEVLKECEDSVTNDDFDKGWKDFCESYIKENK